MWGDSASGGGIGGADTFVFADAFGNDYIYDFHQADSDKIEFQVADVTSFNDLNVVQDGSNTVITTSASTTDSVTLVNYDDTAHPLTASDFLFAIT
jgi:Ca2+-binding RTX toxin-like protein